MSVLETTVGSHWLGGRLIISNLAFKLGERENVAIMAPSGAGKSTLLRLIAGLEEQQNGTRVTHHGKDVNLPGEQIALLAQDIDAFPWMRTNENIWRFGRWPRSETEGETAKLLTAVGLEEFARHFPAQLSGGMRKRLALARVLACRADVVLLDEPFASLDLRTRQQITTLLLATQQEHGYSSVLVTHDVLEAVDVANRILICSGPPLEIRKEIKIQHDNRPVRPNRQGAAEIADAVRTALLET